MRGLRDARTRRASLSTLQRHADKWVDWQRLSAGRIDDPSDFGERVAIERSAKTRFLRTQRGGHEHERDCRCREPDFHDRRSLAATTTTELRCPNHCSGAIGACGSATHALPSTTKAYT